MAMMVTTLMVVPKHWDAFGKLAEAEGLTRSAKLRQMVAQAIHQAEKQSQ
jgi:hypothetical protein